MTLNKLAEIVLNLSNTVETLKNTVETGFANVNQRLDNLEKDVADIKRCPTIKKELVELTD